jgi:hypothetical protein
MILKMSGLLRIENLRHHPAEMVERLRSLLVTGVLAVADPHRKGFYDLEDGDRRFYVHLSPTGTVLLLASWQIEAARQAVPHEAALAEAVPCCG